MRQRILYSISFLAVVLVFMIFSALAENPELMLVGEWQEVTWNFEDEAVEKTEVNDRWRKHAGDGQEFAIHRAETWIFLPDGKLKIKGASVEEQMRWNLKGRGHILQIKYDNERVENYQLSGLSEQHMVLDLETEVRARGIARLTFQKNKN